MDKTAMVTVDIARGAEIIARLTDAMLKISIALLAYLSEYEDWRMLIASSQFDSIDLRNAYQLVHEALALGGFTPANTSPIMILPMKDPFIKALRRLFGKTKSAEGMRLGGQLIGDRFVEDAYVYRIS